MTEGQPQRQHRIEILVVEDNPADVSLIQQGFDRAGLAVRVQIATDGEQALRCLHSMEETSCRPDLILLDWNLPRLSGNEVLRAIKEDENLREIPVVVLTSSEAPEDVLGAYDLHANCFLRKPSDADQFMDVIGALRRFWLGTAVLPPLH